MTRLLIADDHALVRQGLCQLFALTRDLRVVGEAGSGPEVLERLRGGGIDLVLLDMTMPGPSGEDLVARIRTHHPALPILVLTMHAEPQMAVRALRAGANGYVTKDRDADELIGAIRRVAGGGRYIEPGLAERMVFAQPGADEADHRRLSERELQVMRLLAKGLGVTEIAERLAISHKTVSTHKARLMEKMGFESLADLLRYALKQGWGN